jgi:hypothetical protein
LEALLRTSTLPLTNSSFSVLSTHIDGPATDEQWDDEFKKLFGPELHRIPLSYASVYQALARLKIIIDSLKKPDSGLITPIEIEEYQNGYRILFIPREDRYESSIDEKKRQQQQKKDEEWKVKQGSQYVRPELDDEYKKNNIKKVETVPMKPKKKEYVEGGLEIIVDNQPCPRVRIRRCNYGSKAVLKIESEDIIIRKVVQQITSLDNDYMIMFQKNL